MGYRDIGYVIPTLFKTATFGIVLGSIVYNVSVSLSEDPITLSNHAKEIVQQKESELETIVTRPTTQKIERGK